MNVIIMNRYADDFAAYHRYVDHERHRVAYLTTPGGRAAIRDDLAARVYEVPGLDEPGVLLACCRDARSALGPIDRIIALSEFDLEQAAFLREALGVPGALPDRVRLYRDKVAMKRRVRDAGLRVPAFLDCRDRPDLPAFGREAGYPLVLKPRRGAASKGVMTVSSEPELRAALARIDPDEYECEAYVAGPILHVDGLVAGGRLAFAKASRYVNTCLDFAHGAPLGSFVIDDERLNRRVLAFTEAVLEALSLDGGAFHLELIVDERDELVFLEIGARVGGGEIPFLTRDLFGVDLVAEWVRIEMGEPPAPRLEPGGVVGGFLMVPEPRHVPCRVVRAESLTGRVPGLYREIVPGPGEVLDGNGGYDHIGGRFLFRGERSAEVESSIRLAIEAFRLECEPLPGPA